MTAHGHNDPISVGDSATPTLARAVGADDLITLRGHVLVEVFDEHGARRDVREVRNIITTVGRNSIVDNLLASPTLGKPTHMGVGTSSTAAAVGDTTITGETRVALTSKTRSTNVLTLVGDWAAGSGTGTLQEAGVWDASSAGTLWSRAVYGAIVKGASDTLKVTWTWTIG